MFIPLSRPDISQREKNYVLEVLDSGHLSFGEKLRRFEEIFCTAFQSKYAVAMNSGTSALHVAVKSLGLGPGDEVITTPYSFIASSNCLLYEGVKPIFVDIEPVSLNMDIEIIEKAITAKTRGILPVHIFGHPNNMEQIMEIANKYKLRVIEDACEAIGAKWKKKNVGTIGDVGIFAFYPNKQITTGEGGILLTDSEEIYLQACSLRNQGRDLQSTWLDHTIIGYNYRMSDLQAAVGLAQMERLNDILMKREEVADRYLSLISDYQLPISIPQPLPQSTKSWFVFIILLPSFINRDLLSQNLAQKGIETKPYFPVIHLQTSYQKLFGYSPGDYPISEHISRRSLAIPFHTKLTYPEQQYVIDHLAFELERMMKSGN